MYYIYIVHRNKNKNDNVASPHAKIESPAPINAMIEINSSLVFIDYSLVKCEGPKSLVKIKLPFYFLLHQTVANNQ
jgi:hypothetical protein